MKKIMELFTWDKLKKINSSKIINSMYIWIFIVPIILKVFELINKNIYNFEIFNEVITLNLELPFSLTVFYFSAIFFALGNLLIKSSCPLIIFENNSYADFKNEGKAQPYIGTYEYDAMNNEEESTEMYKELNRYQDGSNASEIFEQIIQKYFWIIYDKAKDRKPIRRFFTGLFYILGYLLMLIVLLQNFYYIIKSVF